jgi:hypothetical protein
LAPAKVIHDKKVLAVKDSMMNPKFPTRIIAGSRLEVAKVKKAKVVGGDTLAELAFECRAWQLKLKEVTWRRL